MNNINSESDNNPNLRMGKVERLLKNNKTVITLIASTAVIASGIFLYSNKEKQKTVDLNIDTQNEQVIDNKEEDSQNINQNTETIGLPNDTDYTEIYTDPGSGEKVITNPNKTPEDVMGHDIVTLGFTKLLDRGVTKSQVDKLKSYFLDYSNTLESPIDEVSISTETIGKLVDDGLVNIDFEIKIDREKTLTAEVEYLGLGDPSLKLFDKGKQVFSKE